MDIIEFIFMLKKFVNESGLVPNGEEIFYSKIEELRRKYLNE